LLNLAVKKLQKIHQYLPELSKKKCLVFYGPQCTSCFIKTTPLFFITTSLTKINFQYSFAARFPQKCSTYTWEISTSR